MNDLTLAELEQKYIEIDHIFNKIVKKYEKPKKKIRVKKFDPLNVDSIVEAFKNYPIKV